MPAQPNTDHWLIRPHELNPTLFQTKTAELETLFHKISNHLDRNMSGLTEKPFFLRDGTPLWRRDSTKFHSSTAVRDVMGQIASGLCSPEDFVYAYQRDPDTEGFSTRRLLSSKILSLRYKLLATEGYDGNLWQDITRLGQKLEHLQASHPDTAPKIIESLLTDNNLSIATGPSLTDSEKQVLTEWLLTDNLTPSFADNVEEEIADRTELYASINALVKQAFPEQDFDAKQLALWSVAAREWLIKEKSVFVPNSISVQQLAYSKVEDEFAGLKTDFNFIRSKAYFSKTPFSLPVMRSILFVDDKALDTFSHDLFSKLRDVFDFSGHDGGVHNLVHPIATFSANDEPGNELASDEVEDTGNPVPLSHYPPVYEEYESHQADMDKLDSLFGMCSKLREWNDEIRLHETPIYEEFAQVASSLLLRRYFEDHPEEKEEKLKVAIRYMQQLKSEIGDLLESKKLNPREAEQYSEYMATLFMEYFTLLPYTKEDFAKPVSLADKAETLSLEQAVNALPFQARALDLDRLKDQFNKNDILRDGGDFNNFISAINSTPPETAKVYTKWQYHLNYYHEITAAPEQVKSPFENVLYTIYSNGAGRQLWVHQMDEIERGDQTQRVPEIFMAAYEVFGKLSSKSFTDNLNKLGAAADLNLSR